MFDYNNNDNNQSDGKPGMVDEFLSSITRSTSSVFYDLILADSLFPEEDLYFSEGNEESLLGIAGCRPWPSHYHKNIALLNDHSCLLSVLKQRLEQYIDKFKSMVSECSEFYNPLNEAADDAEDEEREGLLFVYNAFCYSPQ